MKKSSKFVSILAVLAAISGAVIAIGSYMKKKGISLRDALDYKNDIYAEDDDDLLYDIIGEGEEEPIEVSEGIDEEESFAAPESEDAAE